MMTTLSRSLLGTALATALGATLSAGALAQTQLKASHQWPGGKGDVRDEMVQIIAKEVEKADVGLEVRIYPGASLFKPTQQWDAMVEGQLDISAFPLDYAVVTFSGTLSGNEAQAFFEHLGTIDEALFSGLFAGFTQMDLAGSLTNNSMLFLQPAVSKRRFISGLSAAAEDDPRASYSPLKNHGAPTTARAGVAFPGNDWLAFPDGDQYLANVGGSAQLLSELAALRQQHLAAVASLLEAIEGDRVEQYFATEFTCPED